MKKQLLFFILLLLPMTVSADYVEIDGLRYNFDDRTQTAEVGKGYNVESIRAVSIPPSVTYEGKNYSVTSIGEFGFAFCYSLTSVTIPNSVTSIGQFAFQHCHSLTSVTIPNSLTNVERYVFDSCSGLTSIDIPSSVTSIGEMAFSSCSGLTSIDIPSSVTSIGEMAFSYCSALTSVTIPNSVTSIGYEAFYRTAWYDNQPDGVVYAGKNVYEYKGTMPDNTTIVIDEGTYGITNGAFSNCSGLISITIPNSVTTIGSRAFIACGGLTSITIPNSVTTIGSRAFENCGGLTSITIPNSVTTIGSEAFNGTAWYNNQPDGLVYAGKNLYKYKGTMPDNSSILINEGIYSITGQAFSGCTGLTSIIIPNSVTSIGGSAFSGCSGLTSITIPNSVTSIGSSAFSGCSKLTTITIPDSVTSIERQTFQGCFGLTSITIPNSVTSIRSSAFSGCSGLTSITIPNSVTSIGYSAFEGCSNMTKVISKITDPFTIGAFTSVTFDSATLYVPIESIDKYKATEGWKDFKTIKGTAIIDNILYALNTDNKTAEVIEGCNGDVVIPSTTNSGGVDYSVTSIGLKAFENCYNLTSITIPNSVKSIGEGAFEGCSNLTKVELDCNEIVSKGGNIRYILGDQVSEYIIGDNVTSIAEWKFYGCENLVSVKIGKNVTSIGGDAFKGCSGLTSITIPNSVTSIGDRAFYGCANLTKVELDCNEIVSKEGDIRDVFGDQVSEYIIGDNVTSIPEWKFYRCENLVSVKIGKNVTSIGDRAFLSCSNLTKVELDCNKIVSKDYQSYKNLRYVFDSQVEELVLGENVTRIGGHAFYDFSSLISVTIPNSVTSIGYEAFHRTAWYDNQPDGVVYAGNNVYNYKGVMPENTSIIIDDGTYSISSEAFYGRSGLTSITIPNSVTSIGEYAFYGCSNLTKVELNCNEIVSKEYNANSSIISKLFGSQVEEYIIGEGITSIGGYAFYGCTNMKTIDIASTVTSIGTRAFSGSDKLADVTCRALTVPETDRTVFENSYPDCANLHVPATSLSAYQATVPWSYFKSITAMEPTGITLPTRTQTSIADSYDLTGRRISQPQRGLNIIRMKDGTTRKVLVK